jgi:hypothetical protein
MLALWVKDTPLAITVKCEAPAVAPTPLVNVKVDDPLPGTATVAGLKLAVMPVGNPETESATAESKPPRAASVSFSVPFALELTSTLLALEASEKPGIFSVRVSSRVMLPPLAETITE